MKTKLMTLVLAASLFSSIGFATTSNITPVIAAAKPATTVPKRLRGNWVHYRGDIAYKKISFSKHSLHYWYTNKRKDSTGGKIGQGVAFVSLKGNKVRFGFGNADSDFHGRLVKKIIHGKKRTILKFTQPRTFYATHTIHAQYIRK